MNDFFPSPLTIKLFLVAIIFFSHSALTKISSSRWILSNIFSESTMRRCNIHLIKSLVVCFNNGLGFHLRFTSYPRRALSKLTSILIEVIATTSGTTTAWINRLLVFPVEILAYVC